MEGDEIEAPPTVYQPSERRRTVLVYTSTGTDQNQFEIAGADGSSSGDSSTTKGKMEKLSQRKNLMYSAREAELVEDIAQELIQKQPQYEQNYQFLADSL